MRAHWMRLAVLVIVLSLVAGCATAPPALPATQPPAAEPSSTQPPPAPAPTAALATSPSAAPAADLLALVKAFEEAYNRHDVGATLGLVGQTACTDWSDGPRCRSTGLEDLLRYDAALNSQLKIGECTLDGDRATCSATGRNDCLTSGSLDATHYAPVVFWFQDGKIAVIAATRAPVDTQRDWGFLSSLAAWAQQTRPAEWDKAGRGDLLDPGISPTFDGQTGAVMSALCKEYAAVAAAAAPVPTPAPLKTPSAIRLPGRVLFIGDSSSVGLDDLFPKLAASGQPSITVASKLDMGGGLPLSYQYEFSDALGDIRQGKWDVVVLQDDLSMDWPGRAGEFYDYARKFDQAIKQAGAETAFYMPYPYNYTISPFDHARKNTAEDLAAAYSKIGQDLDARVAPVALAFQRSLRERPDLNLYAPDGEHPSWAGIYLTGCVLYATLFGRSPVGLTYRMQGQAPGDWQMAATTRGWLIDLNGADWQISEKDAADLQRIAWETVQEYQAGH
jgi:hypothetical protein